MVVEIDLLKRLVKEHPGSSARRLAYLCREHLGRSDVRRKTVNSLLYSNRNVFRAKGSSPPQWFLSNYDCPRDFSRQNRNFVVDPVEIELRGHQQNVVASSSSSGALPNSNLGSRRRFDNANRVSAISTSLNEIEFRPWQLPAISKWKANNGRGVIEAVTGTGKTHCGLFLIGKYVEAGRRILILVPTVVLLRQWVENIRLHLGIDNHYMNVLGDGNKGLNWHLPITIGVVNSVYKRAEEIDGVFSLLIADECHRYASPSYVKALLPSVPHRLGLTATLERSDDGVEELLLPYFGDVCYSYSFKEALRDDVIAPFSLISIGVNLTESEREQYEYFGEQMSQSRHELQRDYGYSKNPKRFLGQVTANRIRGRIEGMLSKTFTGSMSRRKEILSSSESKLRLAPLVSKGVALMQKAVVFCETTESADVFTEALEGHGVRSCSYHSDKKPGVLNEILEDLADGELDCLVSVRKLDEGVDIDGLDMGVILAGTRQRRQMIQRLGRIIRKKPDGRTSILIHIYAFGTSEDPELNQHDDNQNFREIYEHASRQFNFKLNSAEDSPLRAAPKFQELITEARRPLDTDDEIPF